MGRRGQGQGDRPARRAASTTSSSSTAATTPATRSSSASEKYALHLLPSRHPHARRACPVIGNGVVVDLEVLFDEIDGLEARGVDTSRLLVVSANAHVITPYHRTIDKVTERFLGKRQIGTTGRGIGPAYADKINRVGIRVAGPLRREDPAPEGRGAPSTRRTTCSSRSTTAARSRSTRSSRSCWRTPTGCGRWSPTPRCCSTRRSTPGKTVLFEGGQATMLDVDHGTYPFVTSSQRRPPAAPAPAAGVGADPASTASIGVVKAYTTRVGVGPVPDRAVRRGRRAAARDRRRVRHHHRPRRAAAAGTTRSIARYAARVNGAHRLLPDQARRARPAGSRSRSASPTTSTACGTTRCR